MLLYNIAWICRSLSGVVRKDLFFNPEFLQFLYTNRTKIGAIIIAACQPVFSLPRNVTRCALKQFISFFRIRYLFSKLYKFSVELFCSASVMDAG